jgi:hypothetical protein
MLDAAQDRVRGALAGVLPPCTASNGGQLSKFA